MIPVWLPVAVPWAGAALLAALPRRPVLLGPAVCAASLAASAALVLFGSGDGAERKDALGAAVLLAGAAAVLLAALAGAAGAPSRGEEDRFSAAGLPLLQGAQAMALLAGDHVVAWIGLAAGTGAGAALVALGGGRRGSAAAWGMLLPCGAGLAMALLGVALLGARGASGPAAGLPWLGFVLLLLGYGALAGLAPMHAWLPPAVAVSPPPVAAAVAGLLAPAALHGVLRAASAVGPEAGVLPPATLLVAAGSATVVLAATAAFRRPGGAAREAPGRGATGLVGLAAVGFGLGGGPGTLAGVLLLLGLPFSVGAAVFGAAGGGPVAAALGRVSLAGLPPFAPFAGLALLFSAVAALPAGPALLLGAALLPAVAAQLRALWAPLSPRAAAGSDRGSPLLAGSAWLSLGLALALGVALPEPLAAALAEAARLVR